MQFKVQSISTFTALAFLVSAAAPVFANGDYPSAEDVVVRSDGSNAYLLELEAGGATAYQTAFEAQDSLHEAAKHVCPLGYSQRQASRSAEKSDGSYLARWEVTCHLGISVNGIYY